MRITKITWKIDNSRTHTPNVSDFDLILTQRNGHIYYQKYVNETTLNQTTP